MNHGHAVHFLQRIKRLSTRHAELALGLYRDRELVRMVLAGAQLPPSAECVALQLDDRKQGPFIIVTRAGKFVTCLAQGMRLRQKELVISRRALDRSRMKVRASRETVEDPTAKVSHTGERSFKDRSRAQSEVRFGRAFQDQPTLSHKCLKARSF